MGFALDSFINDIINSSSLNGIFNNPIYTALLIVFIVLIVVTFMFRGEVSESEYSFWTLLFRSAVYILLPTITIVFIHYRNIEREFEERYDNKALTNVVEPTLGQNLAKELKIVGKAEESDEEEEDKKEDKNEKKNEDKNDAKNKKIISGAFKTQPSIPAAQ